MKNTVGNNGTRSLVCERCVRPACSEDEPKTVFVHLQNGEIVPVPDVTEMNLTETTLVLHRGAKAETIYPRSRIYFACCDKDMAPPQC